MAGLMNQQGKVSRQPAGNGKQSSAETDREPNVSPEEQQAYEAFVTNGMKLIYEPKGLPQLLQSIEGDGSPVEGLANALVTVVTRLEDSAEKQGQKIDGDILYHGGVELAEQMVGLAEEAGIHEFSDEDTESALFLALDTYRANRQKQGKLPEDELKASMQELVQADQQGSLDEVVPGIEEYAKRAPKPGQAQQRRA